MSTVTSAPSFNPERAITETRDFLLRNPGFICSFGRGAIALESMPIVCLPSFALKDQGKYGDVFAGELSRVAAADQLPLEAELSSAMTQCTGAKISGIVLIDPFKLSPGDHHTAYNRTWSLYAELGVVTLKLFPELEHANAADEVLRNIVYSCADEYASPAGFERYTKEGQLANGTDSFHYFAMNSLYPEEHPRFAPYNLMVLTNLTHIEKAVEHGGISPVQAMFQELARRGVRPYNGSLPYIVPDNQWFDPPLFRFLSDLVEAKRPLFSQHNEDSMLKATILAYYRIHSTYVPKAKQISEVDALQFLFDAANSPAKVIPQR